MLKLICGPSGCGKTSLLIDAIRKDILDGKRCFLLVPEQQAYISERDLPAVLPQNAGLFFEVVNFSGLAEDVFREYGGVTQGAVDNGIRSLLMWDTLRTLAPLLRQYGKSAGGDATLTSLMLQAVEELHSNGIEADRLESAAKQLPEGCALQKKLYDLALVDAVFRSKTESCFGSDPSDRLLRLAKVLREHRYFEGCRLYIDSFTSFTVQEYAVLREILKQADSVTVSLLTDDFSSSLPHFESTVKTAKRLQKLASEADTPVQKTALAAKTEGKPRALSILERDLWRFDLTRDAREIPEDRSALRSTVCANLYEESEAAALHILELVQNGLRYGDIAVVVRDIEVYRGVLDAAFERHGIPYFLSERTDLSAKPLSRLILSALRAVSRHYHVQDVMTLVKTGLVGVDFADAAMFEEYCETWHISGSRFTDAVWSMNPDGLTTERSARADRILEAANRVRRTVIEPLQTLAAELRLSNRLPDRCRAIYHYLCNLRVSEALSERARTELAAGQRREAGETVRLYRFMTDTLSTLSAVLPDAELTVDELIAALTMLFAETNLGSVPNLHDCVVIGSASTLRVENVKASLLLGLCEGEFPRAVGDDGILSETDKAQLEEFGILLDSRERTRSSEELLYVYRAMTKPTEELYLSTVAAQTDGSARTPSLAFSRVGFLFDLAPESFDADAVRRALGTSPFVTDDTVLKLPEVTVPITLRLSQSKMQTFILCPYRYYSTYHLKLREKKDSRPSYADDGLFLHYVFEKFLRASLDGNGKLSVPHEDEIDPLADRIIDTYLAEVCPLPPEHMDRRLLHLFARLRKLAGMMLRDILGELRMSGFVPAKFEQIIGMRGEDGLPPVTLELKNGSRVVLSGKVDRVDLYEADGKLYVRVVDYKSGVHKFSTDDVRSGMDIQLVLYLFAVLSSDTERYAAGGAQYLYATNDRGKVAIGRSGFLLDDETVRQAADRTPDGQFTKKLILQTEEEINSLTADMNAAVVAAAERILAGDARKTPSKEACLFCPVRAHCDKAHHE